jgi:hypothetical protein
MRPFVKTMRWPNLVMALLYLICLAVQYNDPDPWRWAGLYGLAALSCWLAARGRLPRIMPLVLSLGSMGWAGMLAARVGGALPAWELLTAFEMANLEVEEIREMVGLILVGLWMAALTLLPGRRVPY